ncbi:MAG: hypothetical protein PHT59_00015 [Candidatus Omnitrophica bacterium]|nr:hypothetical protein [Candidatus Omnitrophota bacterium]
MYNEKQLTSLIARYQQKAFALALYLIGGNQDRAYDIVASGFAEAIRATASAETDAMFPARLAAAIASRSRGMRAIPSAEDYGLSDVPPEKRAPLDLMKAAIAQLDFEVRLLLLLRDQMRLPYSQIAFVTQSTEKDARMQMNQARGALREQIALLLGKKR